MSNIPIPEIAPVESQAPEPKMGSTAQNIVPAALAKTYQKPPLADAHNDNPSDRDRLQELISTEATDSSTTGVSTPLVKLPAISTNYELNIEKSREAVIASCLDVFYP